MKKLKSLVAFALVCLCSGVMFACNEVKLTLSTENNVTTLKPGQSVQLVTDASEKQKEKVTYHITDGDEFADLTASGLLSIEEDAVPGEEVKVIAKYNQKDASNELEITVASIELVSISATANKSEIAPGGFANLSYTLNPSNTTEKNISWQIVEGTEIATISGNTLLVSETASSSSVIKVKAVGGNVSSNVLEFSVGQTSSEILTVTIQDSITIDSANTGASKVITANVFNANFEPVSNKNVTFEIREGQEYVSISSNGYDCTLSAIGHGSAILRATLENGAYDETVITAIKAPDQILLPEVLQTKQNINFAIAKDSSIPYSPIIEGVNVCQDVEYIFEKLEGNSYVQGDFGTHSNGELTLTEIGTIRVTTKSTSGSSKQVSTSQVFNVNNGVNVSTFEELDSTLSSSSYKGTPVNIVNMTKHSTYGYDLVPAYIINGEQTISNQTASKINIGTGSVTLYGNNYKIDLSDMTYIADATSHFNSFIEINGNPVAGNTQADHFVIIKDLKIEGNTSIDGTVGQTSFSPSMCDQKGRLKGTFYRGLAIGINDSLGSSYAVDYENIEVTKFYTGMRINNAINSSVKNVRVSNCFSNGLELGASIITLTDMNYGPCGAAGVEITPDHSTEAGLNFNQNQHVTFAGNIETTNVNAANTVYFEIIGQKFPYSIPQILKAIISRYSETQASNVVQEYNGTADCMKFIALMFNDFTSSSVNTSEVSYSNILQNGIINIGETSTTEIDTTHQYIIVPLAYSETMNLGYAILYNWNYVG